MKKIVLTGLVGLFAFIANAQQFKKGDAVEIKNLSIENTWVSGKILDLNSENKNYVVKTVDNRVFNIPFHKDESWIRKPVQALSASMAVKNSSCGSSIDVMKEKVVEEFENDFSEYDSVTVTFNSLEPQNSYKNSDADFGKIGAEVYPFKADVTVRLVSTYKDGSQRKINWQFKRKYLLFQTKEGNCEITLAEKDENLLSKI